VCKGETAVSGLTVKYSEPDEERHELCLMITDNISTKQASDWLSAFHRVIMYTECFPAKE